MKRGRLVLVVGTVLTALWVAGAPASAVDSPDQAVRLAPPDVQHPDLELVAKARGWTLDQAAAHQRAADAVGAIATRIATERPEVFVGSAVSAAPDGPPTLYVKGVADAFVRNVVAASDIEILLADRQPYSFDELEARRHRVHRALEAAGFRNVVTGANIVGGGLIPAAVAAEPDLPTASREILETIPADLRASVVLTVTDSAAFRDTTSFGGMWVTDDGAYECTSGWTVRYSNGSAYVWGVTTAGHCSGTNGIVHPGHGTHSFVFQAEHRGAYGDVEWHTTNVLEDAVFYATSSEIRNVTYLEPRSGISVNETVCQYGRASNDRDCSLSVYDTSIECTLSGVWNNRLVQMNAITSEIGDSGGGWSYNYTAYGSQKGWCNSRDAWSVADLYDEALNVVVQIYE